MNTPSTEGRQHAVLGQKYAFATAALMLGIASFINLLGLEKALLAVAFGWLALKSLPGPALLLRRRWAKAGVLLGSLHVLLLAAILIFARDRIGGMLERLGDLSGDTRSKATNTTSSPDTAARLDRKNEAATPAKETETPRRTVQPPRDTKRFNWQAVESPDYRQYIANLRAIGCPEKTVRDIILADVNDLYRGRAHSQQSATNRFEYWKSGNPMANLMTEQSVARRQALSAEKRDLLTSLLGPDAPAEPEGAGLLNPMIDALNFLPSDKVSPLMELEQRYQARVMETMKQASQGDISGLKKVLAEHDAEVLRVLAPEERFEYDARLSPTSARLRMQMGDFEPSEAEFRQIFPLQKAFEDQFNPLGLQSSRPEDQQARQAAQLELNRQIEAALGADRYREYQQKKAKGP